VPSRIKSKSTASPWLGIWSAAIELGCFSAAMRIFATGHEPIVIWYLGLGAAVAEIYSLFVYGVIKGWQDRVGISPPDWLEGAKRSLVVRYILLVERLTATLMHIGSRGLIYLSVVHGLWWLSFVATIPFAVVDGVV